MFVLFFVISCEEDFLNIGSEVISNTKFDTSFEDIEVQIENSPLERIQSDNISRQLGQYLLGVYNHPDYEKLEASIVSQLGLTFGLTVVDNTYGSDTTVITKIDTAFIRLPYQVTLNSEGNEYEIDSVFGDSSLPFKLNVYRSNTYMNTFNPLDPTKINSYYSDDTFEKIGGELNTSLNYELLPDKNDTLFVVKRRLFDDSLAKIDSIKYFNSQVNTTPVPFARIPLKETEIKEIFLDKFDSPEFESQDAFNDYFRGLILEATGDSGNLISFDFNSTNTSLTPSLEIYYTNTVVESGVTAIDTIYKNHSFPLSGFRVNLYNMENKDYPVNNEIKIQGSAGSEGTIDILTDEKITELRSNDWLINDATLTVYINQSSDTINIPSRLYLYKNYINGTSNITSQIKDTYTEAVFGGIRGELVRDSNGKKEKYTFNLTDYISDIVSGEINYSPQLKLKVFNSSDNPTSVTDTIFKNYSWAPNAVTLFSNLNSEKRPTLRISYSEKKQID